MDHITYGMYPRDQLPQKRSYIYSSTFAISDVCKSFYMCIESNANAHGILLLNSNVQVLEESPFSCCLYMTTVKMKLDLSLLLVTAKGMSADLYRPTTPEGHFSMHWKLSNIDEVKQTVQRMTKHGIPYDVQYGDIDYMDHLLDFTYDKENYACLPEFMQELKDGLHYVIILVGADICGFHFDTTVELCLRWTQLGAFYPLSRNRNALGQKHQAPAVFGMEFTRIAYLDTLFFEAHVSGKTQMIQFLRSRFPADSETHGIDTAFLWGSALMIAPVLQEASTVPCLFVTQSWTDCTSLPPPSHMHTLHSKVKRLHHKSALFKVKYPIIRIGSLETSQEARVQCYFLAMGDAAIVVLKCSRLSTFCPNGRGHLETRMVNNNYRGVDSLMYDTILILGVTSKPNAVLLNGKAIRDDTLSGKWGACFMPARSFGNISKKSFAWMSVALNKTSTVAPVTGARTPHSAEIQVSGVQHFTVDLWQFSIKLLLKDPGVIYCCLNLNEMVDGGREIGVDEVKQASWAEITGLSSVF
ncbi:hypothetical protein JRQ81_015778 [Phrynocephalus forsythii]|uniref:Uncharacterized protein n=1 Tax=Phrynocephalus forsythii TaxID=171643 RepID=A0A9Q0XVM6_9SAUR|nr:hypothetical protein JRQ81_015778 [Phrynocephalus forsythii]